MVSKQVHPPDLPVPANPGLALYESMLLIRKCEEAIIRYYPENEMKTPMHMTMGQEAIPAGVCLALGERGQIFSTYRSHGAFLARTADTDGFFAELYGKETGTGAGKSGSMHLADPDQGHVCSSAIVGTTLPLAAGAAFANRRLANEKIACCFFGEGALDEGSFWETLNLASVKKLPVLLVCEDNGLAVHTPKPVRQGYRSIVDIVRQFDCRVFEDDSNDVERIHDLASEAAAGMEQGPAFMLLKCYRYLEHVGIHEDFDANYRTKSEYEDWLKRDCLALQRKRLTERGVAEKELAEKEKAIEAQIAVSVAKARQAAFAPSESLYRGVFYEED